MFDFLKKALGSLLPQPESEEEAALSEAIEVVVETTNPKIRLLSDYKGQLRRPLKQALGYTDALIGKLPGPVEFNRKAFAMNPLVHAVFGSADSMQKAFSLSRPVEQFFARPENAHVNECFVLLGMDKREQKVLGSAMKGDILRRDIQQVVVSFENHRMVAPARSLEALNQELRKLVLNDFGECALENIERLRSSKNELEEQYRRLQVKLNMLKKRQQGFEALLKASNSAEQQIQLVAAQLTEIGEKFQQTSDRIGTLDDQLGYVARILNQPQEYFQVLPAPLRLNKMGVKIQDGATEQAEDIELAEVRMGKFLDAFAVIVKYPRSEMVPREAYLTKVRAYLDIWS